MSWIRDYTVHEQISASTDPSPLVEFPQHNTNDYILLMLAVDAVNIPALPSGYTDIQNQAGAAQAFRLCYKKVTGADNSEVCPTLSLSVGDEWHIIVLAIANADGTTFVDTSAERTATDNAAPFTWTSGVSSGFNNALIIQFCNSDSGLALTAIPPYTNLVNGDAGSAGVGCAFTIQPTAGAITNCTWTGRANDDTTACLVIIKDDGNGYNHPYADPLTAGQYISALGGTSLIESDTNPASLAYGGIGMKDIAQFFEFDGTSTYVDDTTDINDPGTADVTITNAIGAIWYFGYDYLFSNLLVQISTAQSGGTIVWEYYNGSTWSTLTIAGVLTATGWARITWTPQSNWAVGSVNGSANRYWVRMRISATFGTAPILSRGHIGGWLTTYDAVANAADAGVNPYNDVISLTPAATSNFAGSERLFGSAKDLDTGILIIHIKSVTARDFAVDPSVNDVVYPVTNIGKVLRSGAVSAYGGFIIVLGDADTEYEAYAVHGKGALSASNDDYNTIAIGLNDGAMPYGQIGTLNKSAVTRMLFLPQGANGAMFAYVSTLGIVSKVVFAGGFATRPIDVNDIRQILNKAIGVMNLAVGVGDFNRIYSPLQFGGGGNIYTNVNGAVFQFPTKYDGKKYFDWNANDNIAGVEFYGQSSADNLKFPNCIWKGSQPFKWTFNASHSANAILDFTGNTVQGATVTLRSTVTLTGVKFISCPTFTQNNAALVTCIFQATKITADNIADITSCQFISGGSGHGIEITTPGTYTFTGNTFSGFGADGTTDAAIYNNSGGAVTINVVSGGTPTVRNGAGASTTVNNNVTVKVFVKDAVTKTALENARVYLKTTPGDVEIFNTLTDVNGKVETTYNYTANENVTGRARLYGTTKYKTGDIVGTITSTGFETTILLISDA
jgi:hypothetical protein